MTVEINEAGMAAFLAGPDLRNYTLAAAEVVAREARSRIGEVTGRMSFINPDSIVGVRLTQTVTGPEAEVGLTESGRGADYLLEKAEREKGTGTPGDWAYASAKALEPFGWVVE